MRGDGALHSKAPFANFLSTIFGAGIQRLGLQSIKGSLATLNRIIGIVVVGDEAFLVG